jgi:hypothetical protein
MMKQNADHHVPPVSVQQYPKFAFEDIRGAGREGVWVLSVPLQRLRHAVFRALVGLQQYVLCEVPPVLCVGPDIVDNPILPRIRVVAVSDQDRGEAASMRILQA